LVTRCPCHFPSDVQRYTAVADYSFGEQDPYLEDQYNVIVFSSQGDIPQCKCLANGDLDGDTYLVIWDQELFKHTFDCIHPNQRQPQLHSSIGHLE